MKNTLQALPFYAVSAFFLYEALALQTHLVPSISTMIANQVIGKPPALGVLYGVLFGWFSMLLVLHFIGAVPFWKP